MKKIHLSLDKNGYDIIMAKGLVNNLTFFLKRLSIGKDAIIITNPVIRKKFGKPLEKILSKRNFTFKFFEIPDTENSKSISIAIKLINGIADYDIKKKIFIIAFGGGVVGDLAGFIAAIYRRGVPYIQIPTTLLAQIDSSIGGKTGIDLIVGKNLMGAFNQPKLVLSDIQYLVSLNTLQIQNGLAEAIKYAVINNGGLFKYLENNYIDILKKKLSRLERLVFFCSRIKARIVQKDEREEKGIRTVLNFGHTIGHAIETASGYKGYSHGRAIALGMIAASRISYKLGLIKIEDLNRIETLIRNVGLPNKIRFVKIKNIMSAFYHDKKFVSGRNRLVLPRRIGQVCVIEDVSLKIINDTVRGLIY